MDRENVAVSADTPASNAWLPPIHLAVGAYDARVIGMHMCTEDDGLLSLEARFAYTAHAGSVRALALCGDILVSGSSDETIRAYNVAKRVESAMLVHHSGSVNALEFAKDPVSKATYLLSAADDAAICLTRTNDWRLVKKLSGHVAPVLDIAVHPSSCVALSIAKDRSLFLWNLVTGKVAFSAKTKPGPATSVQWSSSGQRYLVTSSSIAALYSSEGRLEATFSGDSTILSAAFLDENRVVTGGEDKCVRIWDVRTANQAAESTRHDTRVRAVAAFSGTVVSADTGGGLKIWDERQPQHPRIETNVGGAGMRLTTLAIGADLQTSWADRCDDDRQNSSEMVTTPVHQSSRPVLRDDAAPAEENTERNEHIGPSISVGNNKKQVDKESDFVQVNRDTGSQRKRKSTKKRKAS